jgi:hypothetical protein
LCTQAIHLFRVVLFCSTLQQSPEAVRSWVHHWRDLCNPDDGIECNRGPVNASSHVQFVIE